MHRPSYGPTPPHALTHTPSVTERLSAGHPTPPPPPQTQPTFTLVEGQLLPYRGNGDEALARQVPPPKINLRRLKADEAILKQYGPGQAALWQRLQELNHAKWHGSYDWLKTVVQFAEGSSLKNVPGPVLDGRKIPPPPGTPPARKANPSSPAQIKLVNSLFDMDRGCGWPEEYMKVIHADPQYNTLRGMSCPVLRYHRRAYRAAHPIEPAQSGSVQARAESSPMDFEWQDSRPGSSSSGEAERFTYLTSEELADILGDVMDEQANDSSTAEHTHPVPESSVVDPLALLDSDDWLQRMLGTPLADVDR